jgi:hypothetical protein
MRLVSFRPASESGMIRRAVLCGALAFAVMSLLSAAAHAQLFRAYLAPGGSDANPCTLPQPCRLLPAALAAVASGGEIWMLDSANYNTGPVDIAQSVTILAVPGALGSVLAIGGNAINIAGTGARVALRNLVIVPLPGGGGTNGIVLTNGAGLTVENCLIANLPGVGIFVNTPAAVRVTDTTIRDNGVHGLSLLEGARATLTRATISGNTTFGVFVAGSGAGTVTTADIADSTVDGNGSGGVIARSSNASAELRVSVHASRVVRNGAEGVGAQSDLGAAVTLTASSNMLSNNGSGIGAFSAGTKVWASGNAISNNGAGLHNSNAVLESAGDNAVRNNGQDILGIITVIPTI